MYGEKCINKCSNWVNLLYLFIKIQMDNFNKL